MGYTRCRSFSIDDTIVDPDLVKFPLISAGRREGQRGIQRNSQDNEVLWSRLRRLPHAGLHGEGPTRTSWTSKTDLVANL